MDMFQVVSLHSEGRVIALHDDIEDAAIGGHSRNFLHSIPQRVVGVVKSCQDGGSVRGAT